MSEVKMSMLSLALLGGTLYALARALGIDLGIADMAGQLVQLGSDLLHRPWL